MQSLVSILLTDALPRVLTITILIAIGVGLANVAVEFGLVDVIARVGRYLTDPANLPDEVGTAVLTNTVSVTAGYAMLADFRESELLDDRATLVAIVINTFFGFLQHIFTYYGPVLVPILGVHVGLMYVGARAGISLAITAVGLVAGMVLLRGYEYEPNTSNTDDHQNTETQQHTEDQQNSDEQRNTNNHNAEAQDRSEETGETRRAKLERAGTTTLRRLRSIVPRLVVIYSLVLVGLEYVDLESITAVVSPLTAVVGLPGAAVPVILIAMVDPTSGAIAIAPLIGDVFTPTEAVITLLVGSLFSLTIGTVKRSIPFQFGIWGTEFGTKVILVNTGLKAIFISIAILAFLLVD